MTFKKSNPVITNTFLLNILREQKYFSAFGYVFRLRKAIDLKQGFFMRKVGQWNKTHVSLKIIDNSLK